MLLLLNSRILRGGGGGGGPLVVAVLLVATEALLALEGVLDGFGSMIECVEPVSRSVAAPANRLFPDSVDVSSIDGDCSDDIAL